LLPHARIVSLDNHEINIICAMRLEHC
jgi:hypothetical protein